MVESLTVEGVVADEAHSKRNFAIAGVLFRHRLFEREPFVPWPRSSSFRARRPFSQSVRNNDFALHPFDQRFSGFETSQFRFFFFGGSLD